MRIRLPDWIVGLIIKSAEAKPYFHLKHSDGSPYMDRWWLLPQALLRLEREGDVTVYKPVRWLPFAIRLHHIRSSDADRHLHDHPFDYKTWIIAGGYWEVTPARIDPFFEQDKGWRGREAVNYTFQPPGKILSRRASDRHLIKVNGEGAWTIFIQFRKVQPWGFYTPRGKVYWYDYHKVASTDPERPRRVSAIVGER